MTDDYYIHHRRARRHPAGPKYRAVLQLAPWMFEPRRLPGETIAAATHIRHVIWMWKNVGRE